MPFNDTIVPLTTRALTVLLQSTARTRPEATGALRGGVSAQAATHAAEDGNGRRAAEQLRRKNEPRGKEREEHIFSVALTTPCLYYYSPTYISSTSSSGTKMEREKRHASFLRSLFLLFLSCVSPFLPSPIS